MNETRDLLERVGQRFQFPDQAFDRMLRRRDRKRRNKRIASGLVGLALVIGIVLVLGSVLFRTASHRVPADWPTPTGRAAPILRAGEALERPPFGTTLVATDTATGRQRTLTRCQGCIFISDAALSADQAWVAWDVVTCVGACTPAKLANQGVWIAGVDGVPRQLTKPCIWSWSPVVPQLACARTGDDGSELFLVDPADGSRTRIATSEGSIAAVAWAPDGGSIAYGVAPLSLPFKPVKGEDSTGLYIVRSGRRPVRLTGAQIEVGAQFPQSDGPPTACAWLSRSSTATGIVSSSSAPTAPTAGRCSTDRRLKEQGRPCGHRMVAGSPTSVRRARRVATRSRSE